MRIAEVSVRRTVEGLELLSAEIVQAVGLTIWSAIEATAKSARSTKLFADKSGETRGSIHGEVSGFGRGFVFAGGASRLLESGTPPHPIVGKPILRFEIAGQVFYRHMVNHPGTAERPFLSEARRVGEQAAAYGADYFVGEAIRRVR